MKNTPSHIDNMEDYIVTGIYNISDEGDFSKLKERFVDSKDFKKGIFGTSFFGGKIHKLLKKARFIDYYGRSKKEDTFFYDKQMGIISNITDKPLASSNFLNCVGLVVIGKDKQTGKNIAFLTHNNPNYITGDNGNDTNKTEYTSKLNKILSNFKEKCKTNTIDAVLIGGNSKSNFQEYKNFTILLNQIIENNLGFSLETAGGPSLNNMYIKGSKGLIVDTNKRQIHFLKESIGHNTNVDGKVKDISNSLEKILNINKKYILEKTYEDIVDSIDYLFKNINLKKKLTSFDKENIAESLENLILKDSEEVEIYMDIENTGLFINFEKQENSLLCIIRIVNKKNEYTEVVGYTKVYLIA